MTPTVRALTLLALAVPAVAAAQAFTLRPPSIGDALRELDRLADRGARRPRFEQTYVVPERPGQNQVSWFGFEWRHLDISSPAGGTGGIRLYFYDRERQVAERALPSIRASYLRLVDQFHYSPTKRIPYILYSSHREFQATNVFQVTEGTLGVTSPEDLRMSLPYFGDHERFREVSMHELVHQFTIQKLLDLAASEDLESPIMALPLWFIEGIAEYYTKGGLDPETDGYLRDLVWNPDPEQRYEVLPFAEDRLRGYIPTYKLGQARIAFIAENYGKEKIQGFLENAQSVAGRGGPGGGGERAFSALVRRVLNEPLEQVDARWRAWLKRRYYPQYLKIRQDLPAVREYRDVPAEVESFEVSPNGELVLFRGIDRDEGRARLYLMDARHPRGSVEVAEDNQPGVESLHPIENSVMAIAADRIAFAAQDGPRDVIYVQPFRHEPPSGSRAPRFHLGPRREIAVVHPRGVRFIELFDPTFSRDGKELAFVALTERGQQDVYVVSADGGTARQVTDDAFAERDLSWGSDGIYCASDSTDHGRFNVFRIDAATGERTRLTTAPTQDRHPRQQPDGSLLFSSLAGGKSDVWLLKDGAVRRLTDFATGLHNPAAAPGGRGVYASTFYRGRFRLVEVPKVALLDEPPEPVAVAAAPALDIPREAIPADVPRYDPMSARNWRPDAGIVYGGGGQNAVAGRAAVLFSDVLRDRVLYLDLSVYGSFANTQGLALYENRSKRTGVVYGAFHFVQQQIDRTDPTLAYIQREFGVLGARRYPLDRFRRVEAELQVGGVNRYCLTDFTSDLVLYCAGSRRTGGETAAEWERENAGTTLSLGPTVRFGYDTVRFDPATGPVAGKALMLEVGGGVLPFRDAALHGFSRVEASTYYPLIGRSNLTFRAGVGTSFAFNEAGEAWTRSWWLTSADNLRGFYPFDYASLIGSHYYVATAELQVPLDAFIRFFIFDFVEGVAALDFGGVFNHWRDSTTTRPLFGADPNVPTGEIQVVEPGGWEARTLTGVLGVNVLFGPLLLRVHMGHPFDIGGQVTPAQRTGDSWVTNVTLRYFFF
jgi:hypothetical protein